MDIYTAAGQATEMELKQKIKELVGETKVAWFHKVNSTTADHKYLSDWLISTIYPTGNELKIIERVRGEKDSASQKKLKQSILPCITPSSSCVTGSDNFDPIKHATGIMQFDIDHLASVEEAKVALSKIPEILFCAKSASGTGVWGLVRIEDPNLLKQYFKHFGNKLNNLGLKVDPKSGSNPNNKRFYSFDPDPYVANEMHVYRLSSYEITTMPVVKTRHQPGEHNVSTRSSHHQMLNKHEFELAIGQIESRKLDIAPTYGDYLNLCAAMSNQFGEAGKELFHRICRHNETYNKNHAEKMFYNILNGRAAYKQDIRVFWKLYNQAVKKNRSW